MKAWEKRLAWQRQQSFLRKQLANEKRRQAAARERLTRIDPRELPLGRFARRRAGGR